ncbi:unnamed protein product [Echinostoma caproni]|uniref:Exocyst complex component Sec8 n=1 Tax=Echinostoma caproni TaxID=27848 RepID=A0A183A5C1_9TREM|nr:unnamed protein product [Echinostoma caproni]
MFSLQDIMSISPADEIHFFQLGFITLNKITAEARTLCQSVGTENDSPELRERLILLQRLMLKEIYITRAHLVECWRIGAEDPQATTGTNSAERLYAGFVAMVDYHMRSLLNTLHLLNLFPTADTTVNFVVLVESRTSEARSLNTESNTSLCQLIMTGIKKLPDLHTVIRATEEIEMTDISQNSERSLLRSEYLTLRKLLEDVSVSKRDFTTKLSQAHFRIYSLN